MDWTYQYIIYRIQEGGQPEEVYHASLNKDVTYWLQYVAEVGDVLCLTPAHKRNPTDGPKYFSHKEKSGKTVRDENVWLEFAKSKGFSGSFPNKQLAE